MTKLKIFPNMLYRIGGDSFDIIKPLEYTVSREEYNKIKELSAQLDTIIDRINDELYSLISASNDKVIQNKLLNLKRDIFNKRDIKEIDSAVKDKLDTSVLEKINLYSGLKDKISIAEKSLKLSCENEIHGLRKNLKKLCGNETLNLGLNLSSHSFSERLNKYIQLIEINKETLKTELSLIKYLTRISTKTSPFSYFTSTGLSTLQNNKVTEDIDITGTERINTLRINNYLFKALKELIFRTPEIKKVLLIHINPFLEEKNGNFEYIVNRNNIETIQKLSVSPELQYIVEFLTGKKEITYEEIINSLLDEDSTNEEILEVSMYIDKLVEFGIIELDYAASGLDPYWYKKLWLYFSQKEFKYKEELVSLLSKLDETVNSFNNLNYQSREIIIKDVFSLIENTLKKIYIETAKAGQELSGEEADEKIEKDFYKIFDLKAERIFYEDTKINLDIPFNENELHELIEPLAKLIELMNNFQLFRQDADLMKYYFTNKLGKEGKINFLDFYASYSEELKKPLDLFINAKMKEYNGNPENKNFFKEFLMNYNNENNYDDYFLEKIEKRNSENNLFLKNIGIKYKSDEILNISGINLKISEIEEIYKKSYSPNILTQKESNVSYSAFIQFFKKDGKLKAVLNQMLPGYGKFFSRFLHLFDAKLTESIISENNKLLNDTDLFAENSDASFFNGNIHEPILNYEINAPGSHNQLNTESQINIKRLILKYDETNEELILLDDTLDKRVFVLDLGFLNLLFRSQMYIMLDKFSKYKYVSHIWLTEHLKKMYMEENKVSIIPRIIIEDKLVLQRKQWFIPKKDFPQVHTKGGASLFLTLNKWRQQYDIPDEIFVQSSDRTQANLKNLRANLKSNIDDLKPQYISFNNPFTLNLLVSLINKADKYLTFEEMLPGSSELQLINENPFVIEHLMQWNIYG
jgi:hypothetical protein